MQQTTNKISFHNNSNNTATSIVILLLMMIITATRTSLRLSSHTSFYKLTVQLRNGKGEGRPILGTVSWHSGESITNHYFHQACDYLARCGASPAFDQYRIILQVEIGLCQY